MVPAAVDFMLNAKPILPQGYDARLIRVVGANEKDVKAGQVMAIPSLMLVDRGVDSGDGGGTILLHYQIKKK